MKYWLAAFFVMVLLQFRACQDAYANIAPTKVEPNMFYAEAVCACKVFGGIVVEEADGTLTCYPTYEEYLGDMEDTSEGDEK